MTDRETFQQVAWGTAHTEGGGFLFSTYLHINENVKQR